MVFKTYLINDDTYNNNMCKHAVFGGSCVFFLIHYAKLDKIMGERCGGECSFFSSLCLSRHPACSVYGGSVAEMVGFGRGCVENDKSVARIRNTSSTFLSHVLFVCRG